jgi:5-(carboxyamino)imidazole ribonucleotide synthase
MKTVGILGGGQLGMLLAQSIERLGGEVIIYDPDSDAPGCRCVSRSINAAWNDREALQKFVTACDIITYEFENVDSNALSEFAQQRPIVPSASVLYTTQNRAREKTFLKEAGLPHVPFAIADSPEDIAAKVADLRFPIIIKSAFGGYDGKLQKSFDSKALFLDWIGKLNEDDKQFFPAVIEEKIDLALELSCITARSPNGEEQLFPIFENTHTDHILDTTICPARVAKEVTEAIEKIAQKAARTLQSYGLLCTEFFLSQAGKDDRGGLRAGDFCIYINEFAPRPHNSGHVTMSACYVSQFDALARILLDLPITKPNPITKGFFCMGNLLGDVWLAQGKTNGSDLDLKSLKSHPEVVSITLYGKTKAQNKRKMGHFITYANEANEASATALAFRKALLES